MPATPTDINTACQNAAAAFTALSHLTPHARADLLAALDARRDDILSICSDETALTIDELTPEFARMTGTLHLFADLIREGSWVRAAIDTPCLGRPAQAPSLTSDPAPALAPAPALPLPSSAPPLIGPNHDIRSMLVPLGPVAVFGSSNFPLAYGVCGGDTASSLAAGCPVIIKEHPAHPKTGRLLATIAQHAIAANEPEAPARAPKPHEPEAPARAPKLHEPEAHARASSTFLHLLQYLPNEDPKDFSVAQHLVQHPNIQAVGFTGSIPGGLAIETLARERDTPIPVFAEMGSMNIVIILPGALQRDSHGLAMTLADSVLARCGQQCTKPGAILHATTSGATAFIAHLQDRFRTATPRRLLAPWIAESYYKKSMAAGLLGAQILAMADRAGPPTVGVSHALLLECDSKTWLEKAGLREENFGPTTTLVPLHDFSDLNRLPQTGSLAMSIWLDAEDERDTQIVSELLSRHTSSTGRLIFNTVPTGVRVATSMVHGGPFPVTNAPHTTAVGPRAIERWCRPLCFQNCPDALLPPELQNANPRGLWRTINGKPQTPDRHPTQSS